MLRVALCSAHGNALMSLLAALRASLEQALVAPALVSLEAFDPTANDSLKELPSVGQSVGVHRRHDLILLMGLDARDSLSHLPLDQAIRQVLDCSGWPYTVLYGSHQERLEQAAELIANRLSTEEPGKAQALPGRDSSLFGRLLHKGAQPLISGTGAWVWACDTCGDAACEHQLLSDLLAKRSTSRSAPTAPLPAVAADDPGG
ncbi:MAG: hypothetical protein JWP47_95 [Polaromonas sp.]|jgi:hypothetical protein|nr:hypothetical protein [Polaromonas sp.]